MFKTILFHIVLLVSIVVPSIAFSSEQACSSGESWKNLELSKVWQDRFQKYVSNEYSSIEGMALARSLKTEAVTRFEKLFSQYWLAHALERSGHFPIASDGFERLIEVLPGTKEFSDLRMASFACLMKLHHDHSSRNLSTKFYSSWTKLAPSELKDYIAYRWGIEQGKYSQALKQMRNESPLRHVMGALINWDNRDWKLGAEKMDSFFAALPQHAYLKNHINYWRMLAARLHFSSSSHQKAVHYLSLIDKKANELVPALTEMAWAQLKSGKYNDAIGTSLSLQTGWLQNTYSPEGLMVMSMAFNETCYYPESMRSLDLLRNQYAPVAQWLQKNKNMSGDKLYSELRKSLKKESDAPFRLSSEWVRSSAFINRQAEINEIYKQDVKSAKAESEAKVRQQLRIVQLLKDIKIIKKDIEGFRKTESHTALVPDWIEVKLMKLRGDLEEYDSLRGFAPVWKLVKRSNEKTGKVRSGKLLAAIKAQIKKVNQQVASQLSDINENIKFIEVEVYQGATQDMIFSNANPDYADKLAALKKKEGFKLNPNEMKWGSISTNQLSKGEIWEDELGGFKADLPNKCTRAKVARGN